jgi:hypothetical protein
MAWDGNGNFQRTYTSVGWVTDRDALTKILATRHDTNDNDMATGIAACLTKNGESKPTADFKPGTDATYAFGSSVARWLRLWLSESIKFVGASFTTTLGFVAPTATRSITIPDADGTLITDVTALIENYPWAMSTSGGTEDMPANIIYANGTQRVKEAITWGVAAGATDNPETIVYSYSSDSGNNYTVIKTETIAYTAAGNVTTTAWS